MEPQAVQQTNPYVEEGTNFNDKPKQENILVDLLESFVIAIVICAVLYIFIATPNIVSGPSMQPTFFGGQLLLTNKITQWLGGTEFGKSIGLDYKRGDVIVFQKPGDDDLIKRIIGLPGEKIQVKDGHVWINGKQMHEKYLSDTVITSAGTFLTEGEERTIPSHQYVVMGDNRPQSRDSRYVEVGFIDRDWMKGKVVLRYWPLNQFGIIPSGESEFIEK